MVWIVQGSLLSGQYYLHGFGLGRNGALGSGDDKDSTAMVLVDSNVAAVDAADHYTLYLKTDGTVWGAGYNFRGVLWLEQNYVLTPTQVDSGVALIAAGSNASYVVQTDKTLRIHGGSPVIDLEPENVIFVDVGGSIVVPMLLYIRDDGSLWGGGYFWDYLDSFAYGKLIDAGVIQVAAGVEHFLYLKEDHSLWAMGNNFYGQLGDGTTTDREAPVQVASGVKYVAAGEYHSLFIKDDGSLWTMGRNRTGALGDGSRDDRSTPLEVASNVVSATGGYAHSMFIKADGSLWGMGANGNAQLGDGSQILSTVPIFILDDVAGVAAGGFHTMILTNTEKYPLRIARVSGGEMMVEVFVAGSRPLEYQWYHGESGDLSQPVEGADASSYQTPAGDLSKYWVRVSNDLGSVDSPSVRPSSPPKPSFDSGVESSTLVYVHTRAKGSSGNYQSSIDLINWVPVSATAEVINPNVSGEPESELVSATVTVSESTKVFVRFIPEE